MGWLQADLDKIEAAIASGERRVRLNGREVEYHSVGDMLKARDTIFNEINSAAATIARPKSFRARTGKGL